MVSPSHGRPGRGVAADSSRDTAERMERKKSGRRSRTKWFRSKMNVGLCRNAVRTWGRGGSTGSVVVATRIGGLPCQQICPRVVLVVRGKPATVERLVG